jgi:hypothetical protein
MDRPKLAISFSGGRSSAVMTKLCLEKYGDSHDIVVTFANTGCEHPATLDFVRDCDLHWGFNTVWLEAVVTHGEKIGSRHKVVTYDTASRNGEPFEQVIKKYGIPNPSKAGHCTRELKRNVIRSYLRSIGWAPKEYVVAIGIRADEIDRLSTSDPSFIYPLVSLGYSKEMVNAFMRRQPFDLGIPSDAYGNCVWCWKKSLRKLLTVAKKDPDAFDFPAKMERIYGSQDVAFFRESRSTQDILAMAQSVKFEPYADSSQLTIWDELLDLGGACSDGCEVGHD